MRGKPAPISTIVFAAIAVLLAIVVLLFVVRWDADKRFAVGSLVRALEFGELASGDSITGVLKHSKPIADIYLEDDAGNSWSIMTFSHNHEIVIIYAHDRTVFAAHHIVGIRPNKANWYFCDTDLMTRYLTLAMQDE